MIVLLRRQFDLCSIVAVQSLSCLLAPRFGYFSSFSQKPSSEREPSPPVPTVSLFEERHSRHQQAPPQTTPCSREPPSNGHWVAVWASSLPSFVDACFSGASDFPERPPSLHSLISDISSLDFTERKVARQAYPVEVKKLSKCVITLSTMS